jgi:hypothetical protein
MKPELYVFGEREVTIQRFRNQWNHLAARVQFAQEPEPEESLGIKVDLQITLPVDSIRTNLCLGSFVGFTARNLTTVVLLLLVGY